MSSLTEIEEQVLAEVDESLTAPDNWDGTELLRRSLADAIDELSMYRGYFTRELVVPLVASTSFYSLALTQGTPLWIERAQFMDQQRELSCMGFVSMAANHGDLWLSTTGTPHSYIPVSSTIMGVFPKPASDGGAIKLRVVCTPGTYADSLTYMSPGEAFETALINYGRYALLMTTYGNFTDASEAYSEYLKAAGAFTAYESYRRMVATYIIGSDK